MTLLGNKSLKELQLHSAPSCGCQDIRFLTGRQRVIFQGYHRTGDYSILTGASHSATKLTVLIKIQLFFLNKHSDLLPAFGWFPEFWKSWFWSSILPTFSWPLWKREFSDVLALPFLLVGHPENWCLDPMWTQKKPISSALKFPGFRPPLALEEPNS